MSSPKFPDYVFREGMTIRANFYIIGTSYIEKCRLEYQDVFADVINAMAFGGAAVLNPENLRGIYGVCVQTRTGITDQVVK